MRIDPTMNPNEETYQVILDVIKNTSFYKSFLASANVPEIYMQQFWHTVTKVKESAFYEFKMAKKWSTNSSATNVIDHMHQPWRTLASIINKCHFGKKTSNDRLRQSRVAIIWVIINHFLSIHKSVPKVLPSGLLTIKDNSVLSRMKFVRIGKDMFIKYFRGLIPPKKTKGKGSQGKKVAVTQKPASVEVSDEFYSELARKQTGSRRVIKKKVSISAEDNIILEPYVTLELGKFMSLTEAIEEEAARQLLATHERNVTESDPEPARRRQSEQLAADTMQALKANRRSSRSQPPTRGSSEGTGVSPGVPNESTIILTTSSEGTGTKPGVPDEEKIEWVYSDEDKEKKDDDDDKIINIEKTNDEETDDEIVRGDEYVQENVVEEMKDSKVDDTGNGDEEITDAKKADAKKTKEVKDDIKKSELPPSSSSLSVSLGFEIPQIQSPSILIVSSATTPPPPHFVSTISLKLQQTTTPIPTPPVTTKAPPITTLAPVVTTILNPLPAISQRVSVLEKDVQELKLIDHTTELLASLRSEIPSAVNAYLRSSLRDVLQKFLQKHSKEPKQQYSQQVDYKDVIEESVHANVINEVKNLLPKFLLKEVSNFATSVIQSTVVESLFEYELKTILFDNMEKIRSYLTHDKHQDLYDALFNSLCLDDVIACGQADLEKILRKAIMMMMTKMKTILETFKGNAPTKGSKSDKSVHVEESIVEPTEEVIMDTSNNDVVNDVDQPQKDSALKHDWFKKPPRPPTLDPE
ncbi:hypothetical protein Tco_0692261 [Tanacetum coccineum]